MYRTQSWTGRALGWSGALLVAAGTASCVQSVGPGDLLSGVSTTPPASSPPSDIATPGQGTPMPASCKVAASSVTPMAQVSVPAGQFAMGCNPKVDTECRSDENPEHMVQLDAFSIDKTEVTQAQYALCVEAGKCSSPYCAWDPCAKPNLPIACVYREQAADYCAYVGESLPTEAQWEKAARGDDGRLYPWGNQAMACDFANVYGCGNGTQDVGTLPKGASPYGALDMAGNVVEWTLDVYDANYYASSPTDDPTGPVPTPSSAYVGRGGGWRSDETWQRTSSRDQYEPLYVKDSMGIRCVGKATSTAAPPTVAEPLN